MKKRILCLINLMFVCFIGCAQTISNIYEEECIDLSKITVHPWSRTKLRYLVNTKFLQV